MTVEITAAYIQKGIVTIECIDCSEINLERLERTRMDGGIEKSIHFVIDTTEQKSYIALRKWMMHQKCTENKKNWGEALNSLHGTVTDTYGLGKFRVWDI